ncbi:MAG TPA: hypothetical protein VME43_01015, partial [Bryobacteraceae bacterium]|nr:hypothetical protein [Bryobacteraceae bacterium]
MKNQLDHMKTEAEASRVAAAEDTKLATETLLAIKSQATHMERQAEIMDRQLGDMVISHRPWILFEELSEPEILAQDGSPSFGEVPTAVIT